jgi:hypothetical protein
MEELKEILKELQTALKIPMGLLGRQGTQEAVSVSLVS